MAATVVTHTYIIIIIIIIMHSFFCLTGLCLHFPELLQARSFRLQKVNCWEALNFVAAQMSLLVLLPSQQHHGTDGWSTSTSTGSKYKIYKNIRSHVFHHEAECTLMYTSSSFYVSFTYWLSGTQWMLLPVKVWKQITEQLPQLILINTTTVVLQQKHTLQIHYYNIKWHKLHRFPLFRNSVYEMQSIYLHQLFSIFHSQTSTLMLQFFISEHSSEAYSLKSKVKVK